MDASTEIAAWWAGVGALLGGACASMWFPEHAPALLATGAVILVLRAFVRSGSQGAPSAARAIALVLAEVLALVALAFATGVLPVDTPLAVNMALLAVVAQLSLGAIASAVPPAGLGSRILIAGGHMGAATTTISLLVLPTAAPAIIALGYGASFAVLALVAFWCEHAAAAPDDREALAAWEPALLVALATALAIPALMVAASPGSELALGSAVAGLLALPFVAAPPAAPRWLARRRAGLGLVAQAIAIAAFLNAMLIGFAAVATMSARLALVLLSALALVAVALEYAGLRHVARLRGHERRPAAAFTEPVTIVVPARNEAETLRRSLETNLQLPAHVSFLLLPSTSSTDDTIAVAERAAAVEPARIRVVPGVAASKAGDLNAAWPLIQTDLVLLLDADETIDAASLARAVDTIRSRDDIGIVQGRKVSATPDDGWLSRFVTAERRHSTSLDHPLYADEFYAGHFAGSAALLRRQVVPAVGGWSENALTEDIDLTLRVHLDTAWSIVYDSDVVVRESDPTNLAQLLVQRTRWARGWAQCFSRYLPSILARRGSLGTGRSLALGWMLFSAVSAPFFALAPAMIALRVIGSEALLPTSVAITVLLLVLPGRLIAYTYAALRDPVAPIPRRPLRILELWLHAYLWIPLGWAIQFHAAYLELRNAPQQWAVTAKRVGRTPTVTRAPART